MDLPEQIEKIIGPIVGELGFDIVRVMLSGKQHQRLQVMAETKDGSPMTAGHCVTLSHAISAALDVEDPIETAYDLEVSSPGLDRPLVRLNDFERFQGFEARVELTRPIDGQRKYIGRLLGVEDGTIRLRADGADVAVPHGDVRRAKLVITDDLLAGGSPQKQ
jgi:ribosome maturation factor RimP